MNMTRIWEKITGMPHQHRMSDRVSAAAADLAATARNITLQLEPYKNAEDPLSAMFSDLYNRREFDRQSKGSQDDH